MTYDMAVVLGGVAIALYSDLKQSLNQVSKDNVTLGGVMYTDFTANRRAWTISWDLLTEEDGSVLQQLYLSQFTNRAYHMLQIDALGIYIPVKMEVSDKDIKYNGGFAKGFSITLLEQNPIS